MRVHADDGGTRSPTEATLSTGQQQQQPHSNKAGRRSRLGAIPPSSQNRLLVSPFVFMLCWWFLFAMHWINGTVTLIFSVTYLFFSLPAIYPTVEIIGIPLDMLQISALGYAAISAVHWLSLTRITRWSFRTKTLTLTDSELPSKITPPKSGTRLTAVSARLERWQRLLWAPWNRIFGIDGICGVNGAYFYVAFFTREAIEIVLQTYQAQQLSGSVRRAWITHLAVIVIVLNNLSAPIVHIAMRNHQESARRFVSLLVDMCLDFVCAVIIPGCVVYPYVYQYDTTVGGFPSSLVNDDTWFVSSLAEIYQFCVTSFPDLLSTMMPNITVFTTLNVAKKLLQRDSNEESGPSMDKRASKKFSMSIVAARSNSTPLHTQPESLGPSVVAVKVSWIRRRLHSFCHVIMGVWTVGVLVAHIHAHSHAESSQVQGCRLTLSTWFAVHVPCSVMQINCYRDNTMGLSTEIAQSLEPLDRTILKKLIITHCTSLEIPPVLLQFNALTDLDLYNSTLLAWPREAAATPMGLASLINFKWQLSPYIEFPAGLLHANLPPKFGHFAVARSNLTELPDDLGDLWAHQSLDTFNIEQTQLNNLPTSFKRLQIRKLRLISNHLTELPVDALETKRLVLLNLSGNPLTVFPPSIGDTANLKELMAEKTQISNVSDQITQWWAGRPQKGLRRFVMSLAGSPLCDVTHVDACSVDHGYSNGSYRWDQIQNQRTLEM